MSELFVKEECGANVTQGISDEKMPNVNVNIGIKDELLDLAYLVNAYLVNYRGQVSNLIRVPPLSRCWRL